MAKDEPIKIKTAQDLFDRLNSENISILKTKIEAAAAMKKPGKLLLVGPEISQEQINNAKEMQNIIGANFSGDYEKAKLFLGNAVKNSDIAELPIDDLKAALPKLVHQHNNGQTLNVNFNTQAQSTPPSPAPAQNQNAQPSQAALQTPKVAAQTPIPPTTPQPPATTQPPPPQTPATQASTNGAPGLLDMVSISDFEEQLMENDKIAMADAVGQWANSQLLEGLQKTAAGQPLEEGGAPPEDMQRHISSELLSIVENKFGGNAINAIDFVQWIADKDEGKYAGESVSSILNNSEMEKWTKEFKQHNKSAGGQMNRFMEQLAILNHMDDLPGMAKNVVGDQMDSLKDMLSNLPEQFSGLGETLGGLADMLKDWIGPLLEMITPNVQGMVEKGQDILTSATNNATDFVNDKLSHLPAPGQYPPPLLTPTS